jgi:hypothetical protein
MSKNQVDYITKNWSDEVLRKSSRYIRAVRQKDAFQKTAALIALNYALAIFNLSFNLVPGWYLLALTGCIASYCLWNNEKISWEIKLIDADPQDIARINYGLNSVNKTSVFVLAGAILLSGNWAYQVTKNQGIQRLEATNEALSLNGQGWCSNFWEQDAYLNGDGTYESSNSGGWPCVTIRNISSVDFEFKNNSAEMCFRYELTRSNSYPSDTDSEAFLDYGKICSEDRGPYSGSWSESYFSSKLYEEIQPKLEKLQKDMCNYYYYRLNTEEQVVYC